MTKLSPDHPFVAAVLNGERRWIVAHLYTFTSVGGTVERFTDLDLDVTHLGQRYRAGALRIEGLKTKLAVGVAVDEQDVVVWASPFDTLFGAKFLLGMGNGLMDGGTIARDRVIWAPETGDVSVDVTRPPAASWRLFLGYVSTIEQLGRASIRFKVKSPLVRLNADMPHNYYQPGCLHALFDTGCSLDKWSFSLNRTVASATQRMITVSDTWPIVTGADGLPYYQRGRIVFFDGVNAGLETTVDYNTSNVLVLAYPLDAGLIPAVGDQFAVFPGCSKSFDTCQKKFDNTKNFRGFDVVPPVFTSI